MSQETFFSIYEKLLSSAMSIVSRLSLIHTQQLKRVCVYFASKNPKEIVSFQLVHKRVKCNDYAFANNEVYCV